SEFLIDSTVTNTQSFKASLPKIQTPHGNRIADFGSHTYTIGSLFDTRPGEKCEDGTWRTNLIAKIEVIGLRVVKVYRFLYQAQPKRLNIKIIIALRITCNGCYMMES